METFRLRDCFRGWTGCRSGIRRDRAAARQLARMILAAIVLLELATGSTPAAFGFQQEATAPHWIWHP
ncbi:MAG: hypothetical protein WBX00_18820 [Isosphaeraceae bacterium]